MVQACRAAKLFAKHMKLGDQQAALRQSVCHVAACTPHRCKQLADLGDLSLQRLVLVVCDVGLDAKQR